MTREDALMAKLREQVADYARSLGFPIGSIVEFVEPYRSDSAHISQRWVVTGAIQGYGRIELDTWPPTKSYTAMEADLLVLVDADAQDG